MSGASIWNPMAKTVTQANAQGLLKMEAKVASEGQRVFSLDTFTYAVGTGSIVVFKQGKILARNKDYIEADATSIILAEHADLGDILVLVGFVGITGTAVVDDILRADLLANSGTNLLGFLHSGLNTTIPTSASKKLEDHISVKADFGAVGNGIADDSDAFQRAFDSLSQKSFTLYVPLGFYKITRKLNIPNNAVLRIVGDGLYASRIYCASAAPITSIFDTDSALTYDTLEIKDIGFLGNNKAGSAFKCEQFIHSKIERVLVINTTATAIRINNGYNNTLIDNILLNNVNGIDASGAAVNNVNLERNQIYANSGIGVIAGNSLSFNVKGNGIEANAIAGIMAYDIKSLNIEGNYFERNGSVGYHYTGVEDLIVKSDVHILSGGKSLGADLTTSVDCCRIVGNSFTPYGTGNIPNPGLSIDCPIFTTVADKMTVEQNQIYDVTKIRALVGLYNNNTKAYVSKLRLSGNSVNTVAFIGAGNITYALNTGHNIVDMDSIMTHNYAQQSPFDFDFIAGATGSLTRSAISFCGYPAMEMSAGDKIYGKQLDLTEYPELMGKYVWFGMYYRVQDVGGTGILLRINSGGSTWSDNDGSAFEGATPVGTWKFKSACKYIAPTDNVITYSVTRLGAAGNPVVIAQPIFAVFGDGLSKFPVPNTPPIWYSNAAPASGSWKVHDRVLNANPAVGSPKSWVCTVAGAPGTWVSEGNL